MSRLLTDDLVSVSLCTSCNGLSEHDSPSPTRLALLFDSVEQQLVVSIVGNVRCLLGLPVKLDFLTSCRLWFILFRRRGALHLRSHWGDELVSESDEYGCRPTSPGREQWDFWNWAAGSLRLSSRSQTWQLWRDLQLSEILTKTTRTVGP